MKRGESRRPKNPLCACGKRRQWCRQHGGRSVCACGKRRLLCALHGGGSLCECGKRRTLCFRCGGGSLCAHGVVRSSCAVCEPEHHLFRLARNATGRAFRAVGEDKRGTTEAWLGCSPAALRAFVARKMERWNERYLEQMHEGNVELDHIKPISAASSLADLRSLTHFSNLQPLLKRHNASKRARWSAQDEAAWREQVLYNPAHEQLFWPEACPPLDALGLEWGGLALLAEVCSREELI